MARYFLYARKSTDTEDKQVLSVQSQLTEVREYARREKLDVVGELQEARTAKKPGRPIFDEMIRRIEKGEADVGIVWVTEVVEAKKHGRKIDGVAIQAPLNKADEVGYAIGRLKTGRNADNAEAYLAYLATGAAQAIYAKYGFVPATPAELTLRPLSQ